MATFFGGALTAAILFPWNEKRLGRDNALRYALLFIGLALVLLFARAWVQLRHPGFFDRDDGGFLQRLCLRVPAVVLALYVARQQRRRFELFEDSGGEPASLFLVGVAAFVIGLAGLIGLMYAAMIVVGIDPSSL